VLLADAGFIARTLPGALAFLIGAAGWFYLFYSRAASNLSLIEDQKLNARRVSFRRFNAVLMLILAVLLAVGYYAFDPEQLTAQNRAVLAIVWLAVLALLSGILILALIDVRLTYKLRQAIRERRNRS
jgi:Na+/H+ antiporter NhaD/arsenite permease-like protein